MSTAGCLSRPAELVQTLQKGLAGGLVQDGGPLRRLFRLNGGRRLVSYPLRISRVRTRGRVRTVDRAATGGTGRRIEQLPNRVERVEVGVCSQFRASLLGSDPASRNWTADGSVA